MVPSSGKILYDRWIPLGTGLVVFIFFGFGKEAINMYRAGLLAIGFGKIITSLRPDHHGSVRATLGSFNSKAKMLFKRKSSMSSSTLTSDSNVSSAAAVRDPNSPKKATFHDTIDESDDFAKKKSKARTGKQPSRIGAQDIEEAAHDNQMPALPSWISSIFRSKRSGTETSQPPLPLVNLTAEQTTFHAAMSAGEPSPPLLQHTRNTSSNEILVRKEIRHGIEDAETLPRTTYRGLCKVPGAMLEVEKE